MEIVWSARAISDLEAIREFIDTDNPRAAVRVRTRIHVAVGRLAQFPLLGRAGRVAGTRELIIANAPYIVAYRIIEDRIRILAVIHTARRWPSLL
jgi:toxin ParE1/3/4